MHRSSRWIAQALGAQLHGNDVEVTGTVNGFTRNSSRLSFVLGVGKIAMATTIWTQLSAMARWRRLLNTCVIRL